MKARHWIYFTAGFILAWLLLDIGFGMNSYTKFLSWQWHLGFVLRNAGTATDPAGQPSLRGIEKRTTNFTN